MQYEHIIRAVFGQPWAILPETLETIASLVQLRASGTRLTAEEVQERLAIAAASAGPRTGARVAGTVGVIPIYGTIVQRAGLMSDMSGGTSVQGITRAFRQAMADPEIASVLLEIDSPGGEVGGLDELATEIRAGSKPVAAIANTLMASAGYWIASAADEIIASPTSWIGSIGVRTMHVDRSGEMAQAGLNPTVISAGKYKAEDSQYGPLSEDALAAIQQTCDDYYALFVNAVAAGRGTTPAAVRNGYGEGRMLTAKRAVAAGLADRIGTFDQAVARLVTGKVIPRGMTGLGDGLMPLADVLAAEGLDESAGDHVAARIAERAADEADGIRKTEAEAALALAKAKAVR